MSGIVTSFFSFATIRKKIIFLFIIIVVIPVLSISTVFYYSISNVIEDSLSKSIMNSLDIANNSMDKLFSNIVIASNLLTFDEGILQILSKEGNSGKFYYEDVYELDSKIAMLDSVSLFPNAFKICIMSTRGQYYVNWYNSDINYFHRFSTEDWYKKVVELDGYIRWVAPQANYISDTEKNRNFISLARAIKNNKKVVGVLLVSIYEDKFFDNVFKVKDMFAGSSISMVDADGTIVMGQDKLLIGLDMSKHEYIKEILKNERGNLKVKQNGEDILVSFVTNERTGWKVIHEVAYKDLFKKMDSNIKGNFIFIILFLIVFIIVAFMTGVKITQPIKRIRHIMMRVNEGVFDETVEVKSKDEIGQLALSFNTMLQEIKVLIKKVKEEQRKEQQLRFEALQAQINPHFLFNTLNTIKWNALINQDKSTANMLAALGVIMEMSIKKSSEYTTLEKELEVLKSYVLIQKARYNQRFYIRYDIDKKALGCLILKFLIQPVLENSIIHGMNGRVFKINIIVAAKIIEEKLVISIEDDGVGIPEQRLRMLMEEPHNDTVKGKITGIGIKNVHERILLHYGKDYGLKIYSEERKGTRVEINIPVRKGTIQDG